ncbi:LysR family transcriptional regulator [Brevibacillus brevis]|uniref:LysR family transcriptional regulator n=1 Tax=Brevibacillus brevis TaxID=1393 RepID=UPI002699DF3F
MVDFEWYRSFISIYKHSSVSEAARTRMMTQPATSQHLASLEAEVGEPLFTRAPRKMIPTERGKALYTQVVPNQRLTTKSLLNRGYAPSRGSAMIWICRSSAVFGASISKSDHKRIRHTSYRICTVC